MRILKIIHGYPPTYNAGSEVYSQLLCNALQKAGHEVIVFAREENPFVPDYNVRIVSDQHNEAIKCHLINIPLERHRYRYVHEEVDQQLDLLLSSFQPDLVHIGHLNHLSLTVVDKIKNRRIPVVYTIHDFWLMCPRGQFIQRNSSVEKGLWALCSGQENNKCSRQCYAGYFSGAQSELSADQVYWEDWVNRRMSQVRAVCEKIDLFVAPSRALMKRYSDEFAVVKDKLTYMDYGFDRSYLSHRQRQKEDSFVFGYIGTHIPAKGIDVLLKAFASMSNQTPKLRIWGKHRGQNTEGLKRLADEFDPQIQARIEWMPEYQNNQIVDDVFNHVDAIVVPSIWQENSPLVIHEALQARVGVVTADFGGMSEYVQHEKNGWLFKHRDFKSLSMVMDQVLSDQEKFMMIAGRGYLQSESGDVIDINEQAQAFEKIYLTLMKEQADGR